MAQDTTNGTDPMGAPPLPGKAPKSGRSAKAAPEKTPASVQQDDVTIKPANLDTPESDAAIDDIVAHEADEVLAAQDAGIEAAQTQADRVSAEPEKHGHPIFWFIILFLVVIAVIAFVILTNPGLELPFSA